MRANQGGVSIVEAAASLSLLLPLMMVIVFVVLEVSDAYLIKTSLSQGARRAARDLAVAYGQNPAVATSRSLQNAMVLDNVRIHNMINDSRQFDDPIFDTNATPHTVHVTVRYASNQYGLPPFPYPDPLNLGSRFAISA
ncbi:MAG TPA: TadE/TadG family type IV pilus assembly protein, partial [Candidatus Obscuribacterales bacterium]